MHVEQLVQELADAGVYLAVQNGRLVCKAAEGALTEERRRLIAERKAEFMAFLQSGAGDATAGEPALIARNVTRAPLAPTQQQLWFIEQLTESGANYSIPVTYRLTGSLDIDALEKALRRVVERHHSLRSRVTIEEGKPVAAVCDTVELRLALQSLEHLEAEERETEVRHRLQEAVATPFDLVHETPLRAQLFRLAPDDHVLMLTLHHIASDGWSVENLLREVSSLYAAFVAGEPDPLPPLPLQYSDYAIWQREWLQGERLERELGFWRRQLDGAPLVHGLPLDHARPADAVTAGASLRKPLPAALYRSVLETAAKLGATPFMFLEAAFAVLVARWSGETDVVIGTPIANRPRNELAPLIGFFANTLAFRTQLDGNPRFRDVLEETRAVALEAFEHQHLPFELLVEDLNPPRSMSLPPLAQIMFSLQDMDEDAAFDLPGIETRALVPELNNAKFDLNLNLNKTPDGLEACWDYCSDLFHADTIARMADAFEVLLAGLVSNPDERIQHLPLLAADSKETLASTGKARTLPKVAGAHVLFEKHAEANPGALAVADEKVSLSYGELNDRANRIAHALIAHGVAPDARVCIHLERGVDMIAAMLGIMKAGGAYVPLDPAHPAERLEAMLADSGAEILLTQQDLEGKLANAGMTIMLLDDPATFTDGDTHNPDVAELAPSHLAYVLYTSGSTGVPKGVMVEHGNLLNLIEDASHRFGDTAPPIGSAWASFGFDVSVFEVFTPLAWGGALHVVPETIRADVDAFLDWLGEQRITQAYLPPFFVRALGERADARIAGLALRRALVGAESLPENELHRLHGILPELRVVNCYGPTETTVYSSAFADIRDKARNAPIGTAIANTEIYLLDEAMQPVPRGMAGEIYIAGKGVARGYLDRADLTAERFVRSADGERMYRTGDLGRWLPEGQIEFRGRRDQQVKLNGVRIEPGEIEAALVAHPQVKEAVVIVREDAGADQRRLVAYVVSRDGNELVADHLREHLAQRLPAFMLPAAYVTLDALPLTVSGKLDARALPVPGMDAYTRAEFVAPATPLEESLAATWRELLQHERVSVTAGFFDLGGHSLLLTRLQNRLVAEYGVELALKDLFAARSIREQAVLIESLQAGPATVSRLPALQARPADAEPVLSYAQRRLWFIDQMENAGAVYNIPAALHLEGALQPALLRGALQTIVERHEVLRTPLVAMNGEARPVTRENIELPLPLTDLGGLDDVAREQAMRRELEAEAARPFDLGRDLFLRARLLRLGEREHVLLLTLHHIASDGWSMGALLGELAELYEAGLAGREPSLPALSLQYADYAYWQQQWLAGERLEAQWHYWREQLAGVPALHNLPLDHPRPDVQRYNGAVHRQHLSAELLEKLRELARRHDTTLFITLQAAFAVLLARWSGDTDIVMGTPIANRRHEALTPLIGFFVNTLVLRNDLADNPRFDDALAAAKTVALDAYQYQDLPFEMLVDRLRPERSLSHSPLFQVMLALENGDANIPSFGGLDISDAALESRFAKFDLSLNLSETAGGLEACWDYCSDLLLADTIARMAESFETLLEGIATDPARRIQQLPLAAGDMTIIDKANNTARALPDVAGVHQLFEAQAAKTPDNTAVTDGKTTLTYGELDRRANRIAHALIAHGVTPDARVCIHLERGVDMIASLLGVMKAGGAYVPLDPAHPPERLASMLTDSGALVLLTRRGLRDALDTSVPRLLLDDETALAEFDDRKPVVSDLDWNKMAAVLYTSGSTGMPKGVMLEHINLLNLVEDGISHFRDDGRIVASQWTSFGFDISIFEVFVTLAQGGALHIVPDEIRTDCDALLDWLCERRITQACLPPFVLHHMHKCSDARIATLSLRRLLVGVEPHVERDLYRLKTLLPGLYVLNGYGPTETTVYSTDYGNIRDLNRRTPIGRPSSNTQIRILDDAGRPVPVGVVGEIHIAGLGVARGYLNRPDLTDERFIHDTDGTRMYRTGDLGRWLPEGEILFYGRGDQQIKLNGVRIEPGEIEAILKTHPDVRQAVVVVHRDENSGTRQLVAYVVSRDGRRIPAETLREQVASRVPAYMLPAAYVTLDKLPLTVSGKLDSRRLPAPDLEAFTGAGHTPAETALERQLVAVWQELLGHERIGVTTSFFDLGGNSLNAVKLMSAIRKATGKSLPISSLFKSPTIRGLAAQITTHREGKGESLAVLRDGGGETPLFVFHAAGGDVLCYQPMLKHLDPEVPVYGFLRSESADQRVPAFKSVEELAEEYIPQLLKRQPEGPYRLAGWSSGGLLALEVAARLERRGFEVSLVALIDTMLSTGTEVPAEHFAAGLASLQSLSDDAACRFLREFDPELAPAEPSNGVLDIPASDYFNYLVAANQVGLDFHKPDFTLDARVHYFGCIQNQVLHTPAQRVAQIQVHVRQTIVSREFDASHFSIMEEPDVAGFGFALNEALAVEHSEMHAEVAV